MQLRWTNRKMKYLTFLSSNFAHLYEPASTRPHGKPEAVIHKL